MEVIRFIALIFVCVTLTIPASVLGADPNLTVVASSDQGFHFIYTFETELTQLSAAGATITAAELGRTIQIAVPSGASARLHSVIGRSPIQLSSNRQVEFDSLTPALADVSRPSVTRGRRTVGVNVQPLADGVAYGQVEVSVAFERGRESVTLSTANDPSFERIWSASLANYETARNWPVEEQRERSISTLATQADDLTSAAAWYKVSITRTGLIRITGAQLQAAGVSLTGLKSDSIRIFSAGGLTNAIDNTEPRPQFTEISLLILDGGDGNFASSDQLYFYGEAPNRWVFNTTGTPRFVNNTYTESNIYWLAVSGSFSAPARRMAETSGNPEGGTPIDRCWAQVRLEQDNIIGTEIDGHIWDFYNWYWDDAPTMSLQASTPGAIDSDSAYIYVVGKSGQDIDLYINGTAATEISCYSSACKYYTRELRGGVSELNSLNLQLTPQSSSIPAYLDYIEIYYPSEIQPVLNQVSFSLEGIEGETDVRIIDGFSSTPTLLDITDPLHPTIISGYQRSGGFLTFHTALSVDSTDRFHADLLSQAAAPSRIWRATVTDLRSNFSQTDLIVVTAPELVSSLGEYVAYRGAKEIQVVTVDAVMDNFSYGLYDPTAVRDFLKFAYENYPAPSPSGVLFVGDGTYDYLDRLGTGVTNVVPPYIRSTDRTYSDDNFVYFGEYGILDSDHDRGFDMMTARWPVRSTSDVAAIMAKIRNYEATSGLGEWRTTITLVADDEHTNDRHNETFHTTQTETLEKEYVPRLLNREKIYLWEYPFVNREKPAVNDAIVAAVNNGTLLINYVGHGNPDVWSHEHVLQRSGDLPRMTNFDRLPLFYAASCDIGFFDDPQGEGMAEDLLEMSGGGAIAVISATRLVYAADNAQFNRAVYSNLFANPDLTIAEALFAAKTQRQYPNPNDTIPYRVDNDRAYTLFGDPLLRLGLPRYRVEFSEAPDSLVALELSTLRGRIVDESGLQFNGDGELSVTVYDSEQQRSYHLADDTNMIRYAVNGPAIFRGTATIDNGQFELRFVTPLDISYSGVTARVSAYAVLGAVDAVGLVDSIAVSERQSTASDDEGPTVEYSSAKRGVLRNGDFVDVADSLVVRLTDPSGLNLTGGIGHGITLVIDDRMDEAISLTDLFRFDRDSYTTGRLALSMASVEPGLHRFKVKAWDNVNNVATAEFSAEIGASGQLALRDLLNHPNPMSLSTTFYFELTEAVEELKVSVYTLSGKNIWSTSRYGLQADRYPNGSTEIVWDGRDDEGDRVGSGVYIYRVAASTAEAGEVEEFGKLVVLN